MTKNPTKKTRRKKRSHHLCGCSCVVDVAVDAVDVVVDEVAFVVLGVVFVVGVVPCSFVVFEVGVVLSRVVFLPWTSFLIQVEVEQDIQVAVASS